MSETSTYSEADRLRARMEQQQAAFDAHLQVLQQKQAELQELHQYALDLFHDLPVALMTFNQKGRIIEANRAAAAIFGRTRKNLLDAPFTVLIHPDDLKVFLDHLERCRKTAAEDVPTPVVTELRLRHPNREIVFAQLISRSIKVRGQHALATVILDMSAYSPNVRAAREAKAYAQRIIQTIHEPLMVLDEQLKVISVNRAFSKHFGKSEHLIKRQVFEVALNLWWSGNTLRNELENVLLRKWPLRDFFIAVETPTGGKRILQINAQPFERGQDLPTWVLMTVNDVTDRDEKDQRLQRSEAMLAQAQQIAQVGSWEWDIGTDRVTWSRELYSIFGVNEAQFKHGFRDYLCLIDPADRPMVEDIVRQSALNGKPFDFFHRIRRPDGCVRVLHCQGRVSCNGAKAQRMFGVAQDVTELKEAEEQLRQSNEDLEDRVARRTQELQQSNDEMQAFCYTIAHDLRAPLRAIRGLTEALVEDYCKNIDAQGHEFVHRITGATAKMDLLIRDLLAYGRLTTAELPISTVEIEPIIHSVLSVYESEIKERNAKIDLPKTFPLVRGNALIVEMALTNIFSNALKFVAPGVSPAIRISTVENNNHVDLLIIDNGIGIAAEHQKQVFQVFHRLHSDEAYPGTGIGLAVVKKGIERIGGSVGLQSDPGRGSTFSIQLPKG